MDFVCDRKRCTGCAACANICPLNAIEMRLDGSGFRYPYVNSNVCVDCSRCKAICPQNNAIKYNETGSFYAGVSFNDLVKEKSSSGGIFSLLAEKIIKMGGVVFGAAFDKNFQVKHIAVDDASDLCYLRGSKYVQSDIGTCFEQVKSFLCAGRTVLFSGTPCQIDGLYFYLSEEYENLYTVDILCHGVPSPEVFNKYIKNESENKGREITAFDFRSKKVGWVNYSTNIIFGDEEKNVYKSSYMQGFLKNYYLRESCYDCRYAIPNRVGDITLGDFWGYKEKSPEYLEDDNRGISLIIINNKKGEKLFRYIRKKAAIVKKSYDEAAKGNQILYKSSEKPLDYDEFQKDYNNLDWSSLSQKYFTEVITSPVITSKDTQAYISVPFRKRYYKHLLFCKKQEFLQRIKGGR